MKYTYILIYFYVDVQRKTSLRVHLRCAGWTNVAQAARAQSLVGFYFNELKHFYDEDKDTKSWKFIESLLLRPVGSWRDTGSC